MTESRKCFLFHPGLGPLPLLPADLSQIKCQRSPHGEAPIAGEETLVGTTLFEVRVLSRDH